MWLGIYVCIFMSLSLFLCPYLPSPTTCVCVCNSMIDASYLIIESELGFLWKKEKKHFYIKQLFWYIIGGGWHCLK